MLVLQVAGGDQMTSAPAEHQALLWGFPPTCVFLSLSSFKPL